MATFILKVFPLPMQLICYKGSIVVESFKLPPGMICKTDHTNTNLTFTEAEAHLIEVNGELVSEIKHWKTPNRNKMKQTE